ncbi:type II toxin-antitoxin system RelE/ParE family toxin [Methylocaldum sp.]|uniref:type II toxin-antitoxin system RelE/ParE family toxin n=1 Tax=Methylocaldum sp. TaxID=1969727 RepID=UPI002D428015|nr:type II toxin-antitoxin system RelE/ParE family toxin [Methylocaldum sp.]HYE34798.1 type II toxin-antitoxin system RelE/ParE family toxin [Methylocaldum sp.]
MPRFVLTNAAMTDLKSIGRYTQDTWGIAQRNRYLAVLDGSFHDLAANPLMGRDCGDIRSGYRKYPIGKHIVFYRQTEADQIEIVRILHERMDVEARLGDS